MTQQFADQLGNLAARVADAAKQHTVVETSQRLLTVAETLAQASKTVQAAPPGWVPIVESAIQAAIAALGEISPPPAYLPFLVSALELALALLQTFYPSPAPAPTGA